MWRDVRCVRLGMVVDSSKVPLSTNCILSVTDSSNIEQHRKLSMTLVTMACGMNCAHDGGLCVARSDRVWVQNVGRFHDCQSHQHQGRCWASMRHARACVLITRFPFRSMLCQQQLRYVRVCC
jgi:hypothetical protein